MLAVGIVSTVAVVIFAAFFGVPTFTTDARPMILGLPQSVVIALVASGLAVVGLVWMLRIFRGSLDESPPWRHRP